MPYKIKTKKQINKTYKNKYVDVYQIGKNEKGEEVYEIRKVFSTIHENSTLGEDVGTPLEYTR